MNVLFLTTLPTLKACNSPYMQYYFKRFFVLHSSEVIFSFLIKSQGKNNRHRNCIFHSIGNPKGHASDNFFYASHIRHNFPYKLIPISMTDELAEIVLKLSMKTVQVHLIILTEVRTFALLRSSTNFIRF